MKGTQPRSGTCSEGGGVRHLIWVKRPPTDSNVSVGESGNRGADAGLAVVSQTPPPDGTTVDEDNACSMRDEKTIRQRLEQLRGQLLQWGTPDLQVFVITKDELRGWIRALEWILGNMPTDTKGP